MPAAAPRSATELAATPSWAAVDPVNIPTAISANPRAITGRGPARVSPRPVPASVTAPASTRRQPTRSASRPAAGPTAPNTQTANTRAAAAPYRLQPEGHIGKGADEGEEQPG